MKILYTLNSGNPGGMEHYVRYLVEGMVANGHEVHVWCNNGEIVKWYEDAGAKVTIAKINFDFDFSYILRLKKYLKENDIEVVHANELKAVVNTLLAAKWVGTKVLIAHTHTPISEWPINPFIKKLTLLGYSTFVNTFATKEIALTHNRFDTKVKEGIHKDKLIVVFNGVDTAKLDVSLNEKNDFDEEIRKRYSIPKTAFVFGTVGRLTVEKDHATIVNAFYKFLKNDMFHTADFRLLLAGGGLLEPDIKQLAEELGIADKVIITGVFGQPDLIKFYSTIDCFIFASRAEGFGLVLAEAMYTELPIICSDLPVLKEVGDGYVTYFRVGNYAHLAEKMVEAYAAITTDGENSTGRAKERVYSLFTLETFVQNYIKLYSNELAVCSQKFIKEGVSKL